MGTENRKRQREDHPTKYGWLKLRLTTSGNKLGPREKIITQNMKSRRWNKEATVITENQDGISYEVEINGKIHTRNRRFLRKLTRPENLRQLETTEGADNGTRITKIQPQKSGSIQSGNETLRNSHFESKPKHSGT